MGDMDALVERLDSINADLQETKHQMQVRREELDPLLDYVKSKMESEKEWNQFIKDLRLRAASGRVLALFSALFLLVGWGIQHWIKGFIN